METMRDDPKNNGQRQWDSPKGDGVGRLEEEFEGRQVVLESFFLQTTRDFEAALSRRERFTSGSPPAGMDSLPCFKQEDSDSADASEKQRWTISRESQEWPDMHVTVPSTDPTKICRGKYPISAPNLKAPRAKNTSPTGRSWV